MYLKSFQLNNFRKLIGLYVHKNIYFVSNNSMISANTVSLSSTCVSIIFSSKTCVFQLFSHLKRFHQILSLKLFSSQLHFCLDVNLLLENVESKMFEQSCSVSTVIVACLSCVSKIIIIYFDYFPRKCTSVKFYHRHFEVQLFFHNYFKTIFKLVSSKDVK